MILHYLFLLTSCLICRTLLSETLCKRSGRAISEECRKVAVCAWARAFIYRRIDKRVDRWATMRSDWTLDAYLHLKLCRSGDYQRCSHAWCSFWYFRSDAASCYSHCNLRCHLIRVHHDLKAGLALTGNSGVGRNAHAELACSMQSPIGFDRLSSSSATWTCYTRKPCQMLATNELGNELDDAACA
jgi:hypothetical protein